MHRWLVSTARPHTVSRQVCAGWLPDSRRLLARSGNGLALVDSTTNTWTTVSVPTGSKYYLAGAGRTLMVERATVDADVWLMEIRR